jgi:hypothetical protein
MLARVPSFAAIVTDDDLLREETVNFLGAEEITKVVEWIVTPKNFRLRSVPKSQV